MKDPVAVEFHRSLIRLGLSTRAANIILTARIQNFDQLAQCTVEYLASVNGCGIGTTVEIIRFCSQQDIHLVSTGGSVNFGRGKIRRIPRGPDGKWL